MCITLNSGLDSLLIPASYRLPTPTLISERAVNMVYNGDNTCNLCSLFNSDNTISTSREQNYLRTTVCLPLAWAEEVNLFFRGSFSQQSNE